jgi:excisionase family DNA binding protein
MERNERIAMNQAMMFYTPKEVAALLKVSERTVRRWIREGKLRARRFGRQLRIPTEALDKFGQAGASADRDRDWLALATDSFAKDWENEKDAEYDRWREHYGVPEG